jgi:hypothetical protein
MALLDDQDATGDVGLRSHLEAVLAGLVVLIAEAVFTRL